MIKNSKLKKGFSLMEIIVVISIVSLVVTIVGVSFSSFRNARLLDSAAQEILSLVNMARVKSISSENALKHGVHFESDKATLFSGEIFNEFAVDNEELNIHSSLEVSPISLGGGGSDVVFERITGETNNYGTVSVRTKSDILKIKTVKIRRAGASEIEQ